MGEFDLIDTYFRWDSVSDNGRDADGVIIGVGDDAAVLQLDNKQQFVTSIDTLIAGVHFPEQTPPAAIAHKALTVNLSDLAAMGAKAKWFTLALTLPELDHAWLGDFSASLKALAKETSVALVGGDTTRGPLSISIQVMGTVENNQALLRSGANPGDQLFVSGTLGDAAVGLASIQDRDKGADTFTETDNAYCEARLNYPTARLKEAEIIKGFATACIDISDGLLQDVGHILKKAQVSAVIDPAKLPLSESMKKLAGDKAIHYALHGGDDYELLFTVPKRDCDAFIQAVSEQLSTPITLIGEIVSHIGSEHQDVGMITDPQGVSLQGNGYNHFAENNTNNRSDNSRVAGSKNQESKHDE